LWSLVVLFEGTIAARTRVGAARPNKRRVEIFGLDNHQTLNPSFSTMPSPSSSVDQDDDFLQAEIDAMNAKDSQTISPKEAKEFRELYVEGLRAEGCDKADLRKELLEDMICMQEVYIGAKDLFETLAELGLPVPPNIMDDPVDVVGWLARILFSRYLYW
ncbi:hypothetical protein C8R46DRAFT_1282596, partial [Mycena filopes]